VIGERQRGPQLFSAMVYANHNPPVIGSGWGMAECGEVGAASLHQTVCHSQLPAVICCDETCGCYIPHTLLAAAGHQNAFSVVPQFRANGFLTCLLILGYHSPLFPMPQEDWIPTSTKTESVIYTPLQIGYIVLP